MSTALPEMDAGVIAAKMSFDDILEIASQRPTHDCMGEDCELCGEVEPLYDRVDCDNPRCLNSVYVRLGAPDDGFTRAGWTTSDDCGNYRTWCPEHSGMAS